MGAGRENSVGFKGLRERKAVARAVIEPMLVGKRDGTVIAAYKRIEPGTDGRIHTLLNTTGTTTMRLSSSETILEEKSTNLQNMVNKIAALDPLYRVRDVFVPDPGMVLVAGDYKQAEAITTAAYIRDLVWLNKMLEGFDTHKEHAMYSFDTGAMDAVTGVQRKTAKNVTYASLYRAQVPTIVNTINRDEHITSIRVTRQEVEKIRNILLQMHPLEQWWHDLEQEIVEQHGAVRNCFGQRRKLYDPDLDFRVKDAASFKSQSTVAYKMNQNINRVMDERVDQPGKIELLLQIHDELLFQCKPDRLDELQERVTEIMEVKFVVEETELFIPVEWKIGKAWGAGMIEPEGTDTLTDIARREGWL